VTTDARPDRIKGVLSPVVTPFKADLSPDPERFVRQCRWLLSQDVGLAVFGTNSEANSLASKFVARSLKHSFAKWKPPSFHLLWKIRSRSSGVTSRALFSAYSMATPNGCRAACSKISS